MLINIWSKKKIIVIQIDFKDADEIKLENDIIIIYDVFSKDNQSWDELLWISLLITYLNFKGKHTLNLILTFILY